MFRNAKYGYCVLVAMFTSLVGCNKSLEDSVAEQIQSETEATDLAVSNIQGKKLTEVAGQATLPVAKAIADTPHMIPQNAEPYVGRYQAVISCDDPFVACDKGTADFIVNLLADGTAYRTIVHLGQMTFASNVQYHQDHWSYDSEHHQIILHRGNGVEFFYHIDSDQSLVMDLAKISNQTQRNRQYFAQGNAFPKQAYRLVKEQVRTNL